MTELLRRNQQALAQQINDVDRRLRELEVRQHGIHNTLANLIGRLDTLERGLARGRGSGPTEK